MSKNIIAIGIIGNSYRLVNILTGEVVDIQEKELLIKLENRDLMIANIKLNNKGNIVSTNGKIGKQAQVTYYPIVILREFIKNNKAIGYSVIDISGNIRNISKDEVLRVGQKIGFQNAKIVIDRYGKAIKPTIGEFIKQVCN